MKIESLDRDIRQILSTDYYNIPRFQRPYSWGDENHEDFWTDTIVDSGADYFIGSVIVFQREKGRLDVVDGQQRLTTLTIMLSAVRDAFDAQGQKALGQGVQAFMERRNVEHLPEYILQTETSNPFFQEVVQKHGASAGTIKTGPEELTLTRAKRFYDAKLEQLVASIADDPRLSDAQKPKDVVKALKAIRDKVLGLKLILVTVDNEDDAYFIFETLNSRGMNLTIADLVKNHLFRQLKKKNRKVDVPRENWKQIHDLFERSSANIDLSGFIHHQWLSKNEYTSKAKAFRLLKRDVTKAKAQQYLDDLVSDSEHYRTIHEPRWWKWQSGTREMRLALEALRVFRVDQPTPFVLSVLRAYHDGVIRAKLAKQALTMVEEYHFGFTAITGTSSSGGVTKMYAMHAREVARATDAAEVRDSIKRLKDKLRLPSEDVFVSKFTELNYSTSESKQKRLVRYVLEKHYKSNASGHLPDFDLMTIEHVLPQSTATTESANIGNLVLVDEKLNGLLSNKSFELKKKILRGAEHVWIDPDVLDATLWNASAVSQRAESMARVIYRSLT